MWGYEEYEGWKIEKKAIRFLRDFLRGEFPNLTKNQAETIAEHIIKAAIDMAEGKQELLKKHRKELNNFINRFFD